MRLLGRLAAGIEIRPDDAQEVLALRVGAVWIVEIYEEPSPMVEVELWNNFLALFVGTLARYINSADVSVDPAVTYRIARVTGVAGVLRIENPIKI